LVLQSEECKLQWQKGMLPKNRKNLELWGSIPSETPMREMWIVSNTLGWEVISIERRERLLLEEKAAWGRGKP